MNQMLPSPGFNIPSIGTSTGRRPTNNANVFITATKFSSSSLQNSVNIGYQTYNIGYATPPSMMHPQTPVVLFCIPFWNLLLLTQYFL